MSCTVDYNKSHLFLNKAGYIHDQGCLYETCICQVFQKTTQDIGHAEE